MLRDKIIKVIEDAGFDEYKEIGVEEIIFSEDVFAQCARNTCGNYGKNYTCPPASGTMEENKARFLKYKNAIILNKIVFLGEFYEFLKESGKEPRRLLDIVREELNDEPVMIAGGGGCKLCPECAAKTDEPCRFPDKRQYSMEGSGMDIVSMSIKLKMTYNAGNRSVGFFSIIMY